MACVKGKSWSESATLRKEMMATFTLNKVAVEGVAKEEAEAAEVKLRKVAAAAAVANLLAGEPG